jgi:hypothetical protein
MEVNQISSIIFYTVLLYRQDQVYNLFPSFRPNTLSFYRKGVKFYIITNIVSLKPALENEGWNVILVSCPVNEHENDYIYYKRIMKWYKLYPWTFFPDNICVYLDPNIVPTNKCINLINRFTKSNKELLLFKHYSLSKDKIYKPTKTIMDECKIQLMIDRESDIIVKQIIETDLQNTNPNFLANGGVIITKPSFIVKVVCQYWLYLCNKYSTRDELSFPVVVRDMWEYIKTLEIIPLHVRENEYFYLDKAIHKYVTYTN